MRVHSVKMINYKSIGCLDHNKIIIEPNITAIIGKNESGKSNVISGIAEINFFHKMQNAFCENNVNRNSNDESEISYIIVLKGLPDEDLSLKRDTIIQITSNDFVAAGGILDYFVANVKAEFDALYEMAKNNPFSFAGGDMNSLRRRCEQIQIEESLDIPVVDETLKVFEQWGRKVSADQKEQYNQLLQNAKGKWYQLCNLFPNIFYRNDEKKLRSEYRGETLRKELENNKSFLYELIQFLGFTKDQFLQSASGKTDGKTQDLQDRIQQAIEKKINIPFRKFYTVENVTLRIRFNTNVICFSVSTDGGSTMTLGERSDGLRWYLNLFIDVMAHNLPSRQVLYLFDEPGISLHVNAQRELLKLFADLSSKGNQIVYTTHSPYMLDTSKNGIERIRATVKDSGGNTKIYTTAYDANIAPDSQKDTLTPIIRALGMNLSDTFGPAIGKFNVVTEGASDCVFLHAIGKELGVDLSKYAFIPVVGASNVINVSTILYGWGCKFMALFDYDKEGVEKGGKVFSQKYGYDYNEHFIYLKDATENDITEKTYRENEFEIENMVPDLHKFLQDREYTIKGKVLTAKLYANALEDGTYTCPQITLENFRRLFERINACLNSQK